MYLLYFENSKGKRELISKFDNLEECTEYINVDVDKRSNGRFHVYYKIYNYNGKSKEDALEKGHEVRVDVGSHTEFYYIRKEQ